MRHGRACNRFKYRFVVFFFGLAGAGGCISWAADLPDLKAVSADGRWTLVASNSERTLTLRDADQNLLRSYTMATLDGKTVSAAAALLVAPLRQSFVVALSDIAELWEISLNPEARPIFDGLVHDYKMGEAIATPGFLGIRRTPLEQPFESAFVDVHSNQVLGVLPRQAQETCTKLQVINLDIRRRIATFTLGGTPQLESSTRLVFKGGLILSVPDRVNGESNWVDMKTWTVLKNSVSPTSGAAPTVACTP